jgi:hypothetical protein
MVKYTMIKFLRECFNELHHAHADMAKMGIWQIPTMVGMFVYTDTTSKDNNENEEKKH